MTLERLKQISIGWRDPLWTLLLLLGCIAMAAITTLCVMVVVWGIPALNEWRHANAASTDVYEKKVPAIIDKVDRVSDNLDQATSKIPGAIDHTAKDVHATFEITQKQIAEVGPAIRSVKNLSDGLNGRLNSDDGLLVAVTQEVKKLHSLTDQGTATLKSADGLVVELKTKTASTFGELETELKKLGKIEDSVALIMEPIAWNKLRDSAAGSMVQAEGILKDTHDATTYIKGKLITPPRKYPKNPFKKALKATGYFLLDVVTTAPGASVAILKWIAAGK